MNTNFTEEQRAEIHRCAEKFRAAIAAGPQGQIEDGDSPAKVLLMKELVSSPEARKRFLQKSIQWAECLEEQEEKRGAEMMDLEIQIMLDAQNNCKYSHTWADLDPEDGCVHCGFYTK